MNADTPEDDWEEEFSELEDEVDHDSPLEEVLDVCITGATLYGELYDFSPPHNLLDFIHGKLEDLDLNSASPSGKAIFAEVAATLFHDANMQHNPWLACFHCDAEVMPHIDIKLIDKFLYWRHQKIQLTDFYRCPDCGGNISVSMSRCQPDRYLPWRAPEYAYEFDLPE